jgi:hypothetical protein
VVSTITEQDKPSPTFEIEAATCWFLTRSVLGVNPRRMIFRQIKKTKNKCELNKDEIETLFQEK